MSRQELLALMKDIDILTFTPESEAIKVRIEIGLAARGIGQNKENGASSRYLEEVTIPSIREGCKRLADAAEEKIKETGRRYREQATAAS